MRSHRLFLLFVAGSLGTTAAAQESAHEPPEKPASEAPPSRPCPSRPSNPSSKDKPKSKAPANQKESVSACLEAKGTPVDLQEFFQFYVRDQGWRIRGEKIGEDGWVFSRFLEKDELMQLVKQGFLAGRVKWTEGKALVQIETRDLGNGLTRVEISARFRGGGESVDRFAPPRDSWNLDSNGTLEKMLIAALEEHLKTMHSSPPANPDSGHLLQASQPLSDSLVPERRHQLIAN